MARRRTRTVPRRAATAALLSAGFWLAAQALPPRSARACSCAPHRPPAQSLRDADAVFVGTPIHASASGAKTRYRFKVQRAWKGVASEIVEVETYSHSTACGRTFRLDHAYVVYARRQGKTWVDGACSRTRLRTAATQDMLALDRITDGVPLSPAPPPKDSVPSREPPRIEARAPSPPPTTPSARGCSVATASSPATSSPGPRSPNAAPWWLLVMWVGRQRFRPTR